MIPNRRSRVVVAAVLLVTMLAWASAPLHADDEEALFRLNFRVTEFKNGDVASERNYSVLARDGSSVQIRTGNRVPIFPPDGVEYLSVGLHLDCAVRSAGSRIELELRSEINSFVLPEQARESSGDPPIIRAISSQADTAVLPGKRTTVIVIDDVMSDSRYELDVTVTRE